jgi:L-aspartate oxidase
MGGILTDAEGRTSLDGLWAAGEVTSTGAHGANRLASNSLLEAVVFASRIAEHIQGLLPTPKLNDWSGQSEESDDVMTIEDSPSLKKLRAIMSERVGVVRDRDGLLSAIREIAALQASGNRLRFANIVATAKLIAVGALMREESRGAHYRADFPDERPELRKRTYMTLADADAAIREITE